MHKGTRAQRRLGFLIHAITFIATIIVLVIVNYFTGAPYWVQWVVLGWGVGLFCHWFFILGPGGRKTETT